MTPILFVALATPDAAGGYRATFPDLPECVVNAPDLAELLVASRQALAVQLQRIADGGETWPKPTPIEQMTLGAGVIPLLVDIAVDDTPVRVNISLGERLLRRLDTAAEAKGMTRSGFIAQAVRVSLGERRLSPEFDQATRRLQDELRTLVRRVNDSIGPSSTFGRRMAELDDQLYEGVRNAADSVSAAMARRREANAAASKPARRESAPES